MEVKNYWIDLTYIYFVGRVICQKEFADEFLKIVEFDASAIVSLNRYSNLNFLNFQY